MNDFHNPLDGDYNPATQGCDPAIGAKEVCAAMDDVANSIDNLWSVALDISHRSQHPEQMQDVLLPAVRAMLEAIVQKPLGNLATAQRLVVTELMIGLVALEEKLRLHSQRGTGGDLDTRLRAIRQALKIRNGHLPEGHPERLPSLLIARRCTNTIREMNDYRYPSTVSESGASRPAPEKPLKKDDHTPEALGRFFAGHNRTEAGTTRVSRATFVG